MRPDRWPTGPGLPPIDGRKYGLDFDVVCGETAGFEFASEMAEEAQKGRV